MLMGEEKPMFRVFIIAGTLTLAVLVGGSVWAAESGQTCDDGEEQLRADPTYTWIPAPELLGLPGVPGS